MLLQCTFTQTPSLIVLGIQTWQELVQELSGTSESLLQLWLQSIWMKALLASMRFVRTQVRNPSLGVQWALVVLALSGLNKALQLPTNVTMIHHFYCMVRTVLRKVNGHMEDGYFPWQYWLGKHSRKLLCQIKQSCGGMELEINSGCHQVYPWCISTLPQWQNWEGRIRCLCQ